MRADNLLTLTEAAIAAGTYKQRVYKWVQLGRLKPVHTAKGPRYLRRDVMNCDADVSTSPKSHPYAHAC